MGIREDAGCDGGENGIIGSLLEMGDGPTISGGGPVNSGGGPIGLVNGGCGCGCGCGCVSGLSSGSG